jgi:hypothetical protein
MIKSETGAERADADEQPRITATEQLEIYLTRLPPVELPAVEQGNFDFADTLGNAIQFENPKDQYEGVKQPA